MWFKRVCVFDLECGTSRVGENKTRDNSPFNPCNKLVSIHWKVLRDVTDEEMLAEDLAAPVKTHLVFHHELPYPDRGKYPAEFVADMDSSDVCVAHNLKFDANWLRSINIELPEHGWCTMIGEYILARGNHVEKSLKATADRRDVTRKKSDLIDAEFKAGKEFYEIELAKVVEYAEADVQSCAEIFIAQIEDLREEKNKGLINTFKLMNEMLYFLCEIEHNGIHIDKDILQEVGDAYRAEKKEIKAKLEEIVQDVMGDTPINLNSGADLSMVIYSRKLERKEHWKETMNIGTDWRGKPLYPPRMSKSKFNEQVRFSTVVVKRTVAQHCHNCDGTGYIRKTKKDGTPYKNESPCPDCKKAGATYQETGTVAGLKMIPAGVADASVHGFKTDKMTLQRLVGQAQDKDNLVAVDFLQKMIRLNAINTYLDSFVTGIDTWTRDNNLLHANFNQAITRTGRLSSSQPNFQNQPKGNKFPVRKAIRSRFEDGWIYEVDFSGLEFRVAGELSGDDQIISDILNGKDVHKQTAMIINQCSKQEVTKEMRQQAKAYTFGPLFGGRGAGEPKHIQHYFDEFFNIYSGLAEWHKELFNGVLNDGLVKIPSGREYFFPNAKRLAGGRITNATAVMNYPVQGWATGCIVPLSCVRALRRFKSEGLRSKLICSVHDSIVCDVAPEETEQVKHALVWAMAGVVDEAKERWNHDFRLPLDVEVSRGRDWMAQEEIPLD